MMLLMRGPVWLLLVSLLISRGSGNTNESEESLSLEEHVVTHKDGTAEYVPLPQCVLALLPPFSVTVMFALLSALLLSLVMKPNPDPAVKVAGWQRGFTIAFVYYEFVSRSLALISTVVRFVTTADTCGNAWEAYQCFGIIFITGPFIQNALLAQSAMEVMQNIHNTSWDWASWDKAVRNVARFLLTKSNEELVETWCCIPMGTHPDILKEYDAKGPELWDGAYRSQRPPTDEEVKQLVTLANQGDAVCPHRPPTSAQMDSERMSFKTRLLPSLVKSVVQWRNENAAPCCSCNVTGTLESQPLVSDDIDAFMKWRHNLCPFEESKDGRVIAIGQADFRLAASDSSAWLNSWKMRNFSMWLYVYAPFCLALPYAITHLVPGLCIFPPIAFAVVVTYIACKNAAAKMLNKEIREKVSKIPTKAQYDRMTAAEKEELQTLREKPESSMIPTPFEVEWSAFFALPANLSIIVGVQMLMLSSTYWYSGTPWKEAMLAVISERRSEDYFNNTVSMVLSNFDVAARLLTSFT